MAVGIRKVRRDFGGKSIIAKATGWFADVLKIFARPTPTIIGMGVGRVSVKGNAVGIGVPSAPKSLEERLASLEQGVRDLNERLAVTDQRLSEEIKVAGSKVDEERTAREQAEEWIRNKLLAISLGGLDLQVMGVVWLVVGIAVSTVPWLLP